MATTNYNPSALPAQSGKGKFKPYRNRPGKRQSLLELFSLGLLIASAPLFLGGAFSIFLSIATFCLGIIGLFAWTRRHARFFALLAILVIAGAIVNIILRATFDAQCVPFFFYENNFANVSNANNNFGGVVSNGTNNGGSVANGTVTNGTLFDAIVDRVGNASNFNGNTLVNNTGNFTNGQYVGGATIRGNRNEYNHSIWCGNNYIVYITSAIVIGLALAGLLMALAAMKPRSKTPVAARTTETSTTQTRTAEAY